MRTLIELFETSVSRFPNNVLLWEKKTSKFEPTTYSESHEQVLQLAAGLSELGIEKGDRVALLSEGQNAWLISELAILYAGAVNVPLSIKLEAGSDLKFRLEHSGSKAIIISRNQVDKLQSILDELPLLEKIIYIDDRTELNDREVNYSTVMQMGTEALKDESKKASLEAIWKSIQPNDLANISYTSGTTADPKGIMLSHLNYAANVQQSNSLMDIDESFRTLAILPWDHSFAHTACLYSFMVNGAAIGSVQIGKNGMETLRNVPINIKELKPHILMSVPALAKNFRKNIEAGIRKQGKTTEKLFNFALKVGYNYNGYGWNRGKGFRVFLKPLVALFDKILFSKVRDAFGGELRFFVGGGALLDIELQRFFYAIGVPMCQGYGLSEASPVISSNALHAIKFGSSGKLVNNMELRILSEDGVEQPTGQKGEIVIKGDNVMLGYWENPTASAETLKDGWLHTGDMGYMDSDGFLHVLGRFKSLLIGNDGEKFSPEGIEEALVDQSLIIEQAVLYNNQNPYTVGMIVPNINTLKSQVTAQNKSWDSEEGKKAALDLIQSEVSNYFTGGKFEGQFPERWLPASIAVLPEGFTEQNKLLNSTMKVVRGKVVEHFKEDLDHLYTSQGKQVTNERNLKNISNWK
ncbi:long-chain fatty acid--CoA ligase [Prolixibacteraceae bacterium JC049]|nr:long-chain fatty acid--CoA ligase [Prolixibacteraceae bacterium JC049]